MELQPVLEYREAVNAFIREEWGGPMIVTKGNLFDSSELPGFVYAEDGKLLGGILYHIDGENCEIAALFSLSEGRGVGGGLIRAVCGEAKKNGCRRVWLITTNDNTAAIRFYQRQGMTLRAVYINSMEMSRKLKPQIPLTGIDGIPILHEFEFEQFL